MFEILFLLFIIYIIVKVIGVLNEKEDALTYDTHNSYTNTEEYYEPDYYVYKGTDLKLNSVDIENILLKYYPYYKNLETQLQHRFYNRLVQFMFSKNFVIHSQNPFKEMPVIISAAAVQISFGLDEFELSHYKYIQVHQEEYFAENSFRVLAGNVQGNVITLAWNQLLKGFKDYTDGNNVGLHEMAHALYFQEMIVDKEQDEFAQHFNRLMQNNQQFVEQKLCPYNLYTDYAFSNLQEFWAVSVELFFEKAAALSTAYPSIYNNLQSILQQNPLLSNSPIS